MQTILIVFCVVAYIQFFIILAFALRLLPTLLRLAGQCLRLFLFISYRFYRMLLTPLARLIRRRLSINIAAGLWRIAATTLLSLVLGLIIMVMTPLTVSVLSVSACLVHGLLVGVIWDDVEHPGALHLGAQVQ
jgi:hypothetical protein